MLIQGRQAALCFALNTAVVTVAATLKIRTGIPTVAPPTPPIISTSTAAYKTTATRVSTTTSTFSTKPPPYGGNPDAGLTILRTIEATTYEPGPVTSHPHTLVETVVMTILETSYLAYSHAGTTTLSTSGTYTMPRTWVVHSPRPTDLPPSTPATALPCRECASREAWAADERCVAGGMETGCLAQCEVRGSSGAWWCYRAYEYELYGMDPAVKMGRACWGKGDDLVQLNLPCIVGDYRVGCVPCGN